MLSFPGVFTASECFDALDAGADGLKFFPASLLKEENFKAVAIATPPATHKNIVSFAIKNNKHIFCEKITFTKPL